MGTRWVIAASLWILLNFSPAFAVSANIAPLASVQASSENVSREQQAVKAIDTVISATDRTREWATVRQLAGAWITLSWTQPYVVDRIALYDRPNASDRILRGTLTFSDGSSIAVGALANNGSGNTFTFAPKTVTWVKLSVTRAVGTATGLAEFEVYGQPAQPPEPPIAGFSATPRSGMAPLQVSFTDTSTGSVTSRQWDFGDGTTSAEQSPIHTYSAPGTYAVTLTVSGPLGSDRANEAGFITVDPAPPRVSITAPASGASFVAPAAIPISVTASAGTGANVDSVSFYAGSGLVGTASVSPYAFTWNNVPPGDYALTAQLTDSLGGEALSAPVNFRVYDAVLPEGWKSQDVGATGVAGRAGFYAGEFGVTGSGADIGGQRDAFHYAYRSLAGDGEIVARVVSLQNTNSLAKGGVMIRETLTATGKQAMMALTPAGATFQRRKYVGGTAVQTAGPATAIAPYWVKLVRTGTSFSGYISRDGQTWSLVGRDTISMASTVYIGLAVTSRNNTTLCTARFDGISVNGIPVSIRPTVAITGPANGTLFSAPATIALTATASAEPGASIGTVEFFNGSLLLGSSATPPYSHTWESVAPGSYSITAKATDNLGRSATSSPVTVTVVSPPNVSIIAPADGTRLTAPANLVITAAAAAGNGATVAGVEFFSGNTPIARLTTAPYSYSWNSLAPGSYTLTARVTDSLGATTFSAPITITVFSPPAVSLLEPLDGASFAAPATIVMTAAASSDPGLTVARVEFYNGTVLLGQAAAEPYSYTWNDVSGGTYSISARVIDSIGGNASSAAATISVAGPALPVPWETQDLGSVGVGGSAAYESGTFLIKGAGTDIWGTADGFRYVYQPWEGDGQIVARIASQENTDPWAKAGIMFRETLAANSTHALMAITPASGAAFQRRITTGGASTHTGGPLVTAPYWVKLVRSGNSFSGYVSADGTTWELVGSDTIAMADKIFVGLAVSSNNNALLCSASFHGVAATLIPPAPLEVVVTTPVDLASFIAPAAIPITANAAPSDGATITRVDFYNGETLLGSADSSPYSYTISQAAVGTYTLTARITDSKGLTATSAPVTVTVTDPTLAAPWQTSDVGSVGVAGSAGSYGTTFALSGAGTDIWGTADGFRFVYQPLAGDGEITARVSFQQNTDPWAKAGVMIRGTLDASSPHALMAITPGNGAVFQRRISARGTSLNTTGAKVTAPYWVRLQRSGNIISGYSSADGLSWELVGQETITMATNVYVGLAVTSHVNSLLSSATMEGVKVASVPLPAFPASGITLLEEGFEDAQLTARGWFDGGAARPGTIVTDPENPAGGNVLELTYPAGSVTPDYGGAMRKMFPEADDIIVSYRIRYQNGWQWPNLGYGPHEFYLLTNLEQDTWTGMASTFLTTYIEAVDGRPGIIFQDAENIDQNQIGVSLIGITENRGVMGCNGSSDAYPTGSCYGSTGAKVNGKGWIEPIMPPLSNGGWRSVKVHLKMNSIIDGKGVADGVLQYWLDDVPQISHQDVMIRTGAHPGVKWNEFIIAPYFSGPAPQQQTFWIDDLKVTTVAGN